MSVSTLRRPRCPLACLTVAVLLLCSVARAQSELATVFGRVTDASGAVVADAEVEVKNVETNASLIRKTNPDGLYSFPSLRPGHYVISVRKTGFKTVSVTDLTLNVQDNVARNFQLQVGSASESMTVTGEVAPINTTDATVSTVVDRNFAEKLPMNGRSFQTLIDLTPGVVLTPSRPLDAGQFSVNGQRPSSNYWMVDGVSANVGMTPFATTGNAAGGATPGLALQGGTNGLVSVDALQEFRIATSTYAPEFGRTPGAQISILTRSGTNQWHGDAFDYVRNERLDTNDWFANRANLKKPEERQNDFGVTLSGPIVKDRTFFFFSYEGLRLRLPQTALSNVPSLAARQAAIPTIRPLLNAFPLPNGPENVAAGTAQFNASYADSSTLDAASLRLDHNINPRINVFVRYNHSDSALEQRRKPLSNIFSSKIGLQTATAGSDWLVASTISNDFRVNYSRAAASSKLTLDSFGGAVPLSESQITLPAGFTTRNSQFAFTVGRVVGLGVGQNTNNLQRQINFVDSLSFLEGNHSLRFGVDYRRLTPVVNPAAYNVSIFFRTMINAEAGTFAGGSKARFQTAGLLFENLGVFAQDTWPVTPRLTLTYGLRWDVDFAPSTTNGPPLASVTGVDLGNLANLALAPSGTPIFKTKYDNLAPRIGAAFQLSQNPGHETVLRGGFGVFYDLATQELGTAIAGVYPYVTGGSFGAGTFPPTASQLAPPVQSTADLNNQAVEVFDPNLKLPYTLQWNLAIEQSLGAQQTLTASYVGSRGRRLIETIGVVQPNDVFLFPYLVLNAGTSDYNALQLQFQRRLVYGIQALASYTWAHSIDTSSSSSIGSAANVFASQLGPIENRGPSSFDIRHSASAGITWDVPAPKTSSLLNAFIRGWSLETIVQARTAPPVDVEYSGLSFNFEPAAIRPDVVPGVPMYLYSSGFPGGREINPGAFAAPPIDPATGSPTRQGNLRRNALRGFGAFEWDFAVHREFPVRGGVNLQFRAEVFNLTNHPNFGPPNGDLGSPSFPNPGFGQASQMLGRSLNGSALGGEGLSPLYQIGGPRSVQLAMKLLF